MTIWEWINVIGRVLVVFYFLWAAAFNIRTWDFNLSEFKRIGLPGGRIWLPLGLLLQISGSLLFLFPATVIVGSAALIIFTLTADVLFHRYWTYAEPNERTMHQQFLFEHVALIGGIAGLAGSRA